MLVEDDAATRKALRLILSRHGLEVLAVASLAEAILRIGDRVDYVVLDLMLPDGEGVAVLRAIRDAGLSIRVAVTTGSSDRARIEAVRLLRPEVLLFKPIVLEDLVRGLGIAPVEPADRPGESPPG